MRIIFAFAAAMVSSALPVAPVTFAFEAQVKDKQILKITNGLPDLNGLEVGDSFTGRILLDDAAAATQIFPIGGIDVLASDPIRVVQLDLPAPFLTEQFGPGSLSRDQGGARAGGAFGQEGVTCRGGCAIALSRQTRRPSEFLQPKLLRFVCA